MNKRDLRGNRVPQPGDRVLLTITGGDPRLVTSQRYVVVGDVATTALMPDGKLLVGGWADRPVPQPGQTPRPEQCLRLPFWATYSKEVGREAGTWCWPEDYTHVPNKAEPVEAA